MTLISSFRIDPFWWQPQEQRALVDSKNNQEESFACIKEVGRDRVLANPGGKTLVMAARVISRLCNLPGKLLNKSQVVERCLEGINYFFMTEWSSENKNASIQKTQQKWESPSNCSSLGRKLFPICCFITKQCTGFLFTDHRDDCKGRIVKIEICVSIPMCSAVCHRSRNFCGRSLWEKDIRKPKKIFLGSVCFAKDNDMWILVHLFIVGLVDTMHSRGGFAYVFTCCKD